MVTESEIKKVLKERKVLYGYKQAKKALKGKKVESIITASDKFNREFKDCMKFEGSPKQLGIICGKPFGISVLTVLKE